MNDVTTSSAHAGRVCFAFFSHVRIANGVAVYSMGVRDGGKARREAIVRSNGADVSFFARRIFFLTFFWMSAPIPLFSALLASLLIVK